jgi:Ca2+-binding EF-hand superfamily protein
MKDLTICIAIGLCMLALTTDATAKDHGKPAPDEIVKRFDTNGDGLIALAEFNGPDTLFANMDADDDGYVSAAELENGKPKTHERPDPGDFLTDHDGDGDGMVSAAEFAARARPFRMLDTDSDGYVTAAEVEAVSHEHRARFIDAHDGDGDGMVSAAEFAGRAFAHLDADGDGYITEPEAPTGPPRDGRAPGKGRRN